MLIFTSHNLTIVLSPEGHALCEMFLKPFKKTRSTCCNGSKNTRLRLMFLNPNKTLLLIFETLHNYNNSANFRGNIIGIISSGQVFIDQHSQDLHSREISLFEALLYILILI